MKDNRKKENRITDNRTTEKIFRIIEQYHMIAPGMKVIAGISGGADSVCLLYVLAQYQKQIPFELTAVHVEHGIRGEESLGDAVFTEEICRFFDVECRIVSVKAEEVAQTYGISVEEAGRIERYRIFEEIRAEKQADRIAVAHNQNDQAETMLWNLVRGSGSKGLGGIRPVRDRIIRPLLFTSRTEIEEILKEAGITWRTDRTNLETDYTRNRIRLSLLPQMERELNSQAIRHMAEAAHRLQEIQAYLERMRDLAAQRCIRQEKDAQILMLEPCRQEDPLVVRELLRLMLERCGGLKDVGAVHVEMLERLLQMDCGKKSDLPDGVCAVREDGILRVYRKSEQTDMQITDEVIPIPGTVSVGGWLITMELLENSPKIQKQIMEEKKYTKWLSYDTIIHSVHFRTRRTGDYLVINAQGGRKKLKDYFIDQKIPVRQREQIRLFADGSRILWVPKGRISMDAKVLPETKKILKIQMREEIQ